MDVVAPFRRSPSFAHFSDDDLSLLATSVSPLLVSERATVLRQNESSLEAYLIASGEIVIERDTPYGRYSLARLGPGELFGEANFIDHQGRSSLAVAKTDCELVVLDRGLVDAACEKDPRFAIALHWAFWKSLSDKLRRANEHLLHFFSEARSEPDPRQGGKKAQTGQFQIDLSAKRQLFEEQRLSAMEISFLSSLSKAKKLSPGEVIFREGEPGDRMYVVLEGQVRISKHIPGAGEEALAFLDRGDYFGEMALIENQPRSADAKAHSAGAVVLAIPREVVEGVLDIRKVTSLRLLKILCSLVAKRLREIDDKIVGWFMLAGGDSGRGAV